MEARRFLIGLLAFAAANAHAALPFSTAVATYREVDRTYATEAVVEAVHQSTVAAQIAGRVVALNFDVGDFVKQGQVIARIDPSEATQAVAGSQAQVAQALATLENARAQYDRSKRLFEQKFISQAALDRAAADFKAAEAAAAAARAGAGSASISRSYTTLTAPYSGVVAARHVEIGEMAAPGKPIMTGFDPKDLRVLATIPQYKLDEVRRAPHAAVEIPSLGKWIDASGVTVLPSADAATHTTRVRIDLPDNLAGVIPGIYARAHFTVGKARKLLVSQAAVLRRSEVTAVYVVDNAGKVALRQVRLGETAPGGLVEVLAGISPGETVALEPAKAGIYLKSGR